MSKNNAIKVMWYFYFSLFLFKKYTNKKTFQNILFNIIKYIVLSKKFIWSLIVWYFYV